MNEIEANLENHGEFKMSKSVQRNIVLLGRTRTGKSTIKTMLFNPMVVAEKQSLLSVTKDPVLDTLHVAMRNNGHINQSSSNDANETKQYDEEDDHATKTSFDEDGSTDESSDEDDSIDESSNGNTTTNEVSEDLVLNIIDTPGLFERGTDKLDSRDNKIIMQAIDTCVNREITKFHVICFCVALPSGINQEDIQALKILLETIGKKISSNACLIITHCETKIGEQRKDFKKQLRADTSFKEIMPYFEKGIFFSGVLNQDDYRIGSENLFNQYKTVTKYRSKLIKMFSQTVEPFPLIETLISDSERANQRLAALQSKYDELEINFKHKDAAFIETQLYRETAEEKHEKIQKELTDTQVLLERTRLSLSAREADLEDRQKQLQDMCSTDDLHKQIIAELRGKCAMDEHQRQVLEAKIEAEEKGRRAAELERQREAEARRLAEVRQATEAEQQRAEKAMAHERYCKQVEAQQREAQRRREAERQREIAQRRLQEEQSKKGECSIS